MAAEDLYEKVVELAIRRGFFWQSYEIYGGVAGFYDLGPLGARLKAKIIELWRRYFIKNHQDLVVEIETPVIAPARVFEASGHVEHFTDPIVECMRCGRKYRADHLVEEKLGVNAEGLSPEELTKLIREHGVTCPACGGPLGEVKLFNLLFKTTIGPYEGNIGYLRPETAQGMFVDFKRVYSVMRRRMPIGIAQIGRVARNEISPRQGMMRLREFTIAEIEFFFDPENPMKGLEERIAERASEKLAILTAEERKRGEEKPSLYSLEEAVRENIIATPWMAYWMLIAQDFVQELGVPKENTFFEEKLPEEKAHYSAQTFDQLVKVSRWGWVEVSGHSYRTDYDLSRHMKYSGQDLRAFRQYPRPRKVRRKIILVDKAWLGRTYRSKAAEILAELRRLNVEEALRRLEEEGRLIVAGAEIPRDKVSVVEKEESVGGEYYIPHVVEPSFGVERLLYVTLEYAYTIKEGRTLLRLPRRLAPIEVIVLPLTNDERLVKTAREIYTELMKKGFDVAYDDAGSIGRRYARADEIGIPAAVTVDYQTLEDETVTLRDRDTWRQVRVKRSHLAEALHAFLEGASLEEVSR